MNNAALQLKIKQRLNKLASNDYDNIECWQIVEAFNKAQLDWCRRNLHGLNVVQEGDEESTRRIDDFQILLTTESIALTEQPIYFESALLPTDYLQWKRLSIKASSDCCENRPFVVYLAEQANVDELLRDKNKKPSFEWAETFCTMRSNRIQVYTNGEFFVNNASLTYYRQPVKIEILNCVDPYTQAISALDVPCEFKDDIVEVLIDETVKIIAADIESFNQYQRAQQSVEGNN
jgi:hypothetical protein